MTLTDAVRATLLADLPLDETLLALGLLHRPGLSPGRRDILDAEGDGLLLNATADETWAWLYESAGIKPARRGWSSRAARSA